jgi:hypothetical protein
MTGLKTFIEGARAGNTEQMKQGATQGWNYISNAAQQDIPHAAAWGAIGLTLLMSRPTWVATGIVAGAALNLVGDYSGKGAVATQASSFRHLVVTNKELAFFGATALLQWLPLFETHVVFGAAVPFAAGWKMGDWLTHTPPPVEGATGYEALANDRGVDEQIADD